MYALVLAVAIGQLDADSFRAFQDARNAAAESDEAWRKAKKLSLSKAPLPDAPRDVSDMDLTNLNVGDIGYLEGWPFAILDIVGKSDMLIAIRNPKFPPLWLSDYPTDGLADGDQVRIIGLVEVAGTKSYDSVAGSTETVRVIRLLSPERESELKSAEEAKREAALIRTWVDSTGQHKTIGKFLDFKSNSVSIERKPDGKLLSVPMSRLSKDDQKWIREELKRRKDETKGVRKQQPAAFVD